MAPFPFRRSAGRALLLAAVFVSLSPGARAAGQAGQNDEARRHFELGQRYYNVAEFDAAIAEFKRAYELSPAAGLLFNLAQAYRAKKDRERALYFYTTYLREDPAAPERAYVEARMNELREPEPSPPSPQVAAKAVAAPNPLVPTPLPQRDDPGHGLRVAGLITAGGGVALIGTAVLFATRASSASDELSQAFAMRQTWSSHLAEVYSDGQRDGTAAWVLGAAGVAALVTGSALTYLGFRERTVTVAARPTSDGAGVTLRCAF